MSNFREVSPTQVNDWLESDPDSLFLLDVREPHEWDVANIPQATLIPLGQLPGRVAEVPDDVRVVCVCRSGGRSARACEILADAGRDRLYNLTGGVNQWAVDVDTSMQQY